MNETRPGTFSRPAAAYQLARYLGYRLGRRLGLDEHEVADHRLDHIGEFTEPAECCVCGSFEAQPALRTADGLRIVQCPECAHLYTSPRIPEAEWLAYLKSGTERSRTFTENRFQYGRALPQNTKKAPPWWYENVERDRRELVTRLWRKADGDRELEKLHDVGSGIGFTLISARDMGIRATGNELNGPAVDLMRDRLGLYVAQATLTDAALHRGQYAVVTMRDVIEHVYHPEEDVEAAYELLRPGGVLYVRTFHVDCDAFREQGGSWPFLYWNHVNHFSIELLTRLLRDRGFELVNVDYSHTDPLVKIIARKPR